MGETWGADRPSSIIVKLSLRRPDHLKVPNKPQCLPSLVLPFLLVSPWLPCAPFVQLQFRLFILLLPSLISTLPPNLLELELLLLESQDPELESDQCLVPSSSATPETLPLNSSFSPMPSWVSPFLKLWDCSA